MGTHEKDVTLAIARQLKALVDAQRNMRGVLIRDGDYFVALGERVGKARRLRADLLVSIHADAFIKPHARGSSVFALSERGATSAAARWLAKKENEADLIGGVNIDVADPYVKQVLLDLSQTATISDSIKLGRAVLDELGDINTLHKPRVEQAGFAVLKAPDIPSILVETAFISNPEEEKKLRKSALPGADGGRDPCRHQALLRRQPAAWHAGEPVASNPLTRGRREHPARAVTACSNPQIADPAPVASGVLARCFRMAVKPIRGARCLASRHFSRTRGHPGTGCASGTEMEQLRIGFPPPEAANPISRFLFGLVTLLVGIAAAAVVSSSPCRWSASSSRPQWAA